jgi:glutathione S-transferase
MHPQKPGFPADPLERARSRLIGRIADIYLAPQVSPLFRQMNPAQRDATAIETAGKEIAKVFGYVEHAMGPGPFCVGKTPTFGDCALGTSTMMLNKILAAGNFGIPNPLAGGRLATWWQAMEAHPDCGAVLKDYSVAFDGFMKMMAARRAG